MRYLAPCFCLTLSVLITGTTWADDAVDGKDRRAAMRQRIMDEFDADGDGELSDDERAKAREEMRSRRGNRQRGDRPDGDRMRRERPEGRRGEGRRGGPSGSPDPGKLFDRFDADGDGQLSRAEFMKLAEEMRPPRPPRGREGARPDGPPPREARRSFDRQRPLQNPSGDADRPPRREGRPRLKDEDRSGKRDRGARERGRRGPGAGGPDGQRPPNPEKVFERFDEDGDDQLSRDEFMKLSDKMREMRERMMRGRGPRGDGPPRDRDDDGPRRRRPQRPQFEDGADMAPTDDNAV